MAYLGNSPGVASQRVESAFTATASQTVFTPTSGYTLGYCDVYQNGVKLVNGDDYTAADGATITLATGAAEGDSIVIVASFPRGLSDGYLKAEADAKYVAKTGSTMTGDLVLDNGNADGAQLQLASSGYSAWNLDNYSGRLRAYYGSTEYFTVNANGNVGIGVTPSAWGTNWSGRGIFQLGDSGSYVHGGGTGWSATSYAYMGNNGYYDGTNWKYTRNAATAQYMQEGGAHVFLNAVGGTAGSTISLVERMRIDTSGNVSLPTGNLVLASGKGIDFSANSNAGGMTGELLNDYEEGTWTPTCWNSSWGLLTAGVDYVVQTARYVKVGNMVTITIRITDIRATKSHLIFSPPFASMTSDYVLGVAIAYATTGAGEIFAASTTGFMYRANSQEYAYKYGSCTYESA